MPQKTRTQFAALPFRLLENGRLEILLVTSRETRRWVIPKGWPVKGMSPRDVAAREAFEEAGLVGRITGTYPIGCFHYAKQLPKELLPCEVKVFLLRVDRQLEDWPEREQRETGWFDPAEASTLVAESGLAEILRTIFTRREAPGLSIRPLERNV